MNQIHNTTKKEVEKTKHHPTLEHNKNNHRELKKRRTVNNTTLDWAMQWAKKAEQKHYIAQTDTKLTMRVYRLDSNQDLTWFD